MKNILRVWITLAIVGAGIPAEAGNWANWRGPYSNGSAEAGDYPATWTPDQPLWKSSIPGNGFSTPIVWNKVIYLTSGVDGVDTVLAYDWSGKKLWEKTLGPETPGKHKNASGCNPSVVTDGKGLFVFFKSGAFAAFDLDGALRWKKNLFELYGKDDRFWDFGSSPALTEKYVVMAQMHDGDSWVAAFDKGTGDVAWKVARDFETPTEGRQSYTTPLVFSHQGVEALLIWGGQHLTAHRATDGATIWSCGGFNPKEYKYWPAVASPVISGSIAVVPGGRVDRRQPLLKGVRLGGAGDVTETHSLWTREDTSAFVPTPAASKGRVYVISDTGGINCFDPETGKDFWSGEFPKGKGKFYASPLVAGDRLIAAREDGIAFVVGTGDAFEILAQIDMGERIIASPIALEGRLFLRTESALYCFGKE